MYSGQYLQSYIQTPFVRLDRYSLSLNIRWMTIHQQKENFMAKQDNTSFDKSNKSEDKKINSGKQSDTRDNTASPDKNMDTESEFAVNELREEKRDSQ